MTTMLIILHVWQSLFLEDIQEVVQKIIWTEYFPSNYYFSLPFRYLETSCSLVVILLYQTLPDRGKCSFVRSSVSDMCNGSLAAREPRQGKRRLPNAVERQSVN
jgi:hypothetical protein